MVSTKTPSARRSVASVDAACRDGRTLARLRIVDKVAIVGLSIALTLAGCTAKSPAEGDSTMPATYVTGSAGLVTNAPLETAMAAQTLPVYWLGHSNDDVFLYREFFPAKSADDPIVTALRTMMSTRPVDADYFSLWNNPSKLGASVSAQNVITIDVSADAFGQKVDAGIAERSVAQLVYTATAAASMAGLVDATTSIQVSVLVDGHTGYQAFGHVPLDKPLTRNPAFVAPVWIIDPANDATYSKLPLKVDGQGVSPTGNLAWSLATMDGATVGEPFLDGTAKIEGGANKLSEFTFNLVPPPGHYQLSVYIADPGAPGGRLGIDTKLVTISGPTLK